MSETKKGMESLQSEGRKFPPPANIQSNAWIDNMEQYQTMWEKSINDPDGFWLDQAKTLTWFKEPTKSLEYTWDTKARKIEHTWFKDGELNVSYNCLDRHLGTPIENKDAIVWQGEAEDAVQKFTYKQLHAEVCKFANVMKAKGIKKRRPRSDLHADGSRTVNRHAGVHPYRCDPLDHFRRFQR